MPQELTKEMSGELTEGKVRPFDKVKITWSGNDYIKAGTVTEEHPVLAEKLVTAGKAEYVGAKSKKKEVNV